MTADQIARYYRRFTTGQLIHLLNRNMAYPIQTVVTRVRLKAASAILSLRYPRRSRLASSV